MQCIKCEFKNPGTVLYCQKCGEKMDMTADEVAVFYQQKIREERRQNMQAYAFRSLVLAVIIFLISLTFMIVAGGEPPNTSYIPSAVKGSESLKVDYRVGTKLEPLLIPLNEDRK
jgi:uncharacterized membrane protein YvbJ